MSQLLYISINYDILNLLHKASVIRILKGNISKLSNESVIAIKLFILSKIVKHNNLTNLFISIVSGCYCRWSVENCSSPSSRPSLPQNGSLFWIRFSGRFPADVSFHSCCPLAGLYLARNWQGRDWSPVWLDSTFGGNIKQTDKWIIAGKRTGGWDPIHHSFVLHVNQPDEYRIWERCS